MKMLASPAMMSLKDARRVCAPDGERIELT